MMIESLVQRAYSSGQATVIPPLPDGWKAGILQSAAQTKAVSALGKKLPTTMSRAGEPTLQRLLPPSNLQPLSDNTLKNAFSYSAPTRKQDDASSALGRVISFSSAAQSTLRSVRAGEDADAQDAAKSLTERLQEIGGDGGIEKPKGACESCATRKYQDGSDDSGVSYQSAKGMSASLSGVRVASHEGEHVTHETDDALQKGETISHKKVTLQAAFCPDCGRMYYAGGTTTISKQSKQDSAKFNVKNAADLLDNTGEALDLYT